MCIFIKLYCLLQQPHSNNLGVQ